MNSVSSVLDPHPLVSVIIPVYNGAEWIGQAIESALAQTFANFEVIVVDDGSEDRTFDILQQYAGRDPRITVLQQANQGVARARNRAIETARGELIAPLDADDIWLPEKIERQVARLQQAGPGTGYVYCWWAWIDHESHLMDRSPRWRFEGDAFESLLKINFTGNASVPLFRKQCVLDAGGYNEALAAAGAGGCEDWELALRVASRYDIAVVPAVLLGYRRTGASMSAACDTMWRSQLLVLNSMRHLRPNLSPSVLPRAKRQFALYLAGLSYWSGRTAAAFRWALRAGFWLPLRVAPYVLRMLFSLEDHSRERIRFSAGESIPESLIPEPLIPYDRIYPVAKEH